MDAWFRVYVSVQFSCSVMSNSLWPHGPQDVRPSCSSPTPGVYSNSCPSSRWCYPITSSSVVSFSSCLQLFPAAGSFLMSQFFASGGQSIGVSASGSVLPMNSQVWSPLGWTGWISLQSKGLLRIFSNTTVQKHQFFGTQLGCSPWGLEDSDTTEQLHFHFSLSCIGKGNGNPLQCSCLENPRDGGAWWAAVYGVAQSRTWLKRLNSSSSFLYSPTLASIHDYWKNHSFD